MNDITGWFSPEVLRPLGLALLHFLWQGAALAALAAFAMALTKRASVRYVVGIVVMIAMIAAPLVTFVMLQRSAVTGGTPEHEFVLNAQTMANPMLAMKPHSGTPQQQPVNAPEKALIWLVEAWFLGVLLFSMRTAGGVLVLERLRRREATTVGEDLLARCLDLQRRMRLDRAIRYCESIHLDAPAVIGWVRPVVLLPFCALVGLSESQLGAVIAHELAHIKRYDAFVNLFQVAAESVLFYHPAVWWLSKRIRSERENCCDDAAIAICGSPLEYARALTLMEEWRATPLLAMAANHGALASRVRRVLGAPALGTGMRTAGLAAGVLFLSVAVAAGNAFFGVARSTNGGQTSASQSQREKDIASAIVVRGETPLAQPIAPTRPAPVSPVIASPVAAPAPATEPVAAPNPTPRASQTPQANPAPAAQPQVKESYIDSMKSAGLGDLSVDELIAMKIQGVTAEYVRSLTAEGLKVDADNVIAMKVQGVTPGYIREMRANTDVKVDVDEIIGMKVQGVTPEYIHQMKELGLNTDADSLIGMKVQGVTPEYVREMRAAGVKADSDGLVGMKIQGITPAYIKEMESLGIHANDDDLIGLKVQGVTSDYIKTLQAAGFKVDADDAISAKVQGITPEFIEKSRSHGFKNLDLEKLIELKHAGVLE